MHAASREALEIISEYFDTTSKNKEKPVAVAAQTGAELSLSFSMGIGHYASPLPKPHWLKNSAQKLSLLCLPEKCPSTP